MLEMKIELLNMMSDLTLIDMEKDLRREYKAEMEYYKYLQEGVSWRMPENVLELQGELIESQRIKIREIESVIYNINDLLIERMVSNC